MLLLKIEIFYEYPLWFIPFCLLLGILAAGLIYFKKDIVDEPEKSHKQWKKALAVSRFVLVSILAWLLLSPFLKSTDIESEAPTILLLQDNTSSLENNVSTEYLEKIKELSGNLEKDYTLISYGFDSKLKQIDSLDFTGNLTNISASLEEGIDLYKSRNLSAIILASDGIYNNGSNPIYNPKLLNLPIYSIGLGDTTSKKDLLIDRVQYNKIAYLNDRIKLKVSVQNKKLSGKSNVKLYKIEGDALKEIQVKNIEFSENDAFIESEFILNAEQVGVQHYRIQVAAHEEEHGTKNNSKDFFLNILDGRQKILIAALAPHPDIAAIKTVAEQNKNYEVDVAVLSLNQTFNAEGYSSVIFHQIPAARNKGQHWIDAIEKAGIPSWFITGTQTDFNKLNAVQNLVKVNQSRASWNDVSAATNKDFQLFSISEKAMQTYRSFPPLKSAFAKYDISAKAHVLFYQQIGSVRSDFPLHLFQNLNNKKTAVTLGEGLWRWHLYEYLENKNQDAFKELVNKTLQYLAVKDDKRKFRILQEKDIFSDNEIIRLEGELYNDNYQLINEPVVKIVVSNASGKEYPYLFKQSKQAYELNISGFEEGNYDYTASTQWAGKNYSYSGKFSIQATQVEAFQTEANHKLMYQLAEESAGGFFEPTELDALEASIRNNTQIRPSSFEVEKNQAVLNFKLLFFLLILLLSFEWAVRKYLGAY